MRRYFLQTVAAVALWLLCGNLRSQEDRNILPADVLAFPSDEAASRLQPAPTAIWGEQKILAWAVARGFRLSADAPLGGWQFRRAAMLEADRYSFSLYTLVDLRGDSNRAGWELVLDIAAPVFDVRQTMVRSEQTIYTAISTADIYIDGIWAAQINSGFGYSFTSPLRIPIPYVRHPEGRVRVDISMPNRPDNVLFLYDAFLSR